MGRNSMGEVAGSAAHTAVANPFSYSAFVGQNIVQFESDMHHLALRCELGFLCYLILETIQAQQFCLLIPLHDTMLFLANSL